MSDSWATTEASFKLDLSSNPSGVRAEITLGGGGWFATGVNARAALAAAVALVPNDLLPSSGASPSEEKSTLNLASDAEVARVVSKRVAVYRDDIVALLEEAAEAGSVVRISGRKVDGGRYEGRRVQVLRVEDRRVGFGHTQQYLKCVDMLSDDARTFRVDGIERVEAE